MKYLSFCILSVALFSSCIFQGRSYAVLIWPDSDQTLQAGTVFYVLETSQLQNTVTITTERGRRGESHIVDSWRVFIFDTMSLAQEYSNAFNEWKSMYGISVYVGQALRDEPELNSTKIYRLREGEAVKILSRQDTQTEVAEKLGYWYQVLTREGIQGWIFETYIELTSAGGRPLHAKRVDDSVQRLLLNIHNTKWYPEYFQDAIDTGYINLATFRQEYGLFTNIEGKQLRITLPAFQKEFIYTDAVLSGNSIVFEGAELRITREAESKIRVYYSLNGREQSTAFISDVIDVETIIFDERERRQQLIQDIMNRGNTLVSTAFGTIRLSENGGTEWSNFNRLVPSVIPQNFMGSAQLDFSIFIDELLRDRYDGALQFRFDNTQSIIFLYTVTETGIRLVYVPKDMLEDDQVIKKAPLSPIILFYRFTQT